ncbi:nitronate monooxygenase [Halopseudomonas sabulinigri]|uniref:Nitronate monooxygenase n=1 Tax=Halopseudomonas sabulinigri TaxID=472181 RepID=A0A1H1TU04_9GAMM|nr:nitronate monooxygenase [Halopseudomonas sabulinigri]SDS63682.1 nitronate monooxygenase [Halopseudomonas sabulinigri]
MRIEPLLGTRLPIIQAPMAGVQNSALALAVCRAGGLGSLPCAMLSAEALVQELELLSAEAAGPWNLNFFAHSNPPAEAAREQQWRAALAPYYAELGLDIEAISAGAGRRPFDAATLELIAPFRPPVVSFHFGLPEAAIIERIKGWGGKVLSTATTLAEGRWLQAHGADAVIAQGLEAGGHRGHFLSTDLSLQMGTFALLPQLVAALDIPVIAAGGIADADGVAAAMALGAAGVQLGTSYLLCPEATTSQLHRAALQSEAAQHTALTNLFSGGAARGIVNRVMRELGPLSETPPPFPLAGGAITPLRSAAEQRGSSDFSPLWSGQNNSGCKAITAAELTLELAAKVGA